MNNKQPYIPKPALWCLALVFQALLTPALASAQNNYHLIDSRNIDVTCIECERLINSRPKEVLFGISINPSGEVYFSISNKQWFEKIFAIANSISADIVLKDRYACGKEVAAQGWFKGYVMPPLYKTDFKQNMVANYDDDIVIKLGTLPPQFLNKHLEGNLIIASSLKVCFYTHFVNIDQAAWQILPMGLYADTLTQPAPSTDTGRFSAFLYTKKLQVTIPFEKNKSIYNSSVVKQLYDSLSLKNFDIKKVELMAYSSVEGMLPVNESIMKRRATAVVNTLKRFQPSLARIKINVAENWLEFFRDIKNTPYAYMASLGKQDIKIKLLDTAIAAQLENILAQHRKVIATIYVTEKSASSAIPTNTVLQIFDKAVADKNIPQAKVLQKEIIERVADNKLPEEYLHRLEVPFEKDYAELINDREVYKYQLKLTPEYDALEVFEQLRKIDTGNGRILYNICALTLQQWQTGDDSVNSKALLADIRRLPLMNIDTLLVKRMLINCNILLCNYYMGKLKYNAKDSSLFFIKQNYTLLHLTDNDRYALARYFAFYTQQEWAMDVIRPRIGQLDVSEDIIFYYINLIFYYAGQYETEEFKKAILSAININRDRYCHFFDPTGEGGASMQLLEYKELRKLYCENCAQ